MSAAPDDGTGRRDHDGLRRRIAAEAARSVAAGTDARRAVFRAARRVARGWVPPDRLPGLDELRGDVATRHCPGHGGAGAGRLDRVAALVGLLATVRRDPASHPEGDALEHALQVFHIVHEARPYDEELLTAALVQEIGLAIDRDDPVAAGLAALGDSITLRTRWLVEAVAAARALHQGSLGHRARRRLESHPDFEAATLLEEADRRGRVRGGAGPSLDEAVAILKALDREATGDDPVA